MDTHNFWHTSYYCFTVSQLHFSFLTDFTEDDRIFIETDGDLIANMSDISIITNSTSGTLVLSGTALQSIYELILREVYYENTADEPGDTQRLVQLTIGDRVFTSSAFTTVIIIPTNDPAFFNFTSRQLTFDEEARTPLYLFSQNDTLIDPDGGTLQWITITIISPSDPNDMLVADVQGTGLQINGYGGSMLNISGEGSFMDYERVLNTVTYNNLFPGMDTMERMIHVFTFDGTTLSFVHNITVNVTPYDDPPICFFDNTLVSTFV